MSASPPLMARTSDDGAGSLLCQLYPRAEVEVGGHEILGPIPQMWTLRPGEGAICQDPDSGCAFNQAVVSPSLSRLFCEMGEVLPALGL